ncbi:hypothetical protein ATO11_11490 [Pseudaestuariivita atlantica]|uniref:PilN domain-containing protein n=2 Tax=Pseudaestuariivita atlantica TaxID=1317121 RepID=A0A0L1JPU8_9RHOB|nr:hypothetical protein ATO11_11490 [Pseudaestuariivita atlantica]
MRVVPDGKPRRRTIPKALLTGEGPQVRGRRMHRVIDLVVPPDLVLKRTVTAPATARGKLEELALLDLRRRTPFGPEDVHWTLDPPHVAGDTLTATQWVAKRADVAAWRERLEEAGYRLRKLVVEGASGSRTIADFTRQIAPGAQRVIGLNLALALIAAGAATFGWLYPAWEAQRQATRIETEIARLRSDTLDLRKDVQALRAQDAERSAFWDAITDRPILVDTLRAVTDALPDEAWIDTLTYQPDRAVLTGETGGTAADLVLRLNARDRFDNTRLSGAVSRTSEGAERFQISLDLRAVR